MSNNETHAAIIDSLPTHYDELGAVVDYKRLGRGQANANYVVQTTTNKYFLKIIPESQYNRLPRQVSFYTNVKHTALKTVQPLKTNSGLLVCETSGQKVLLFPYEPLDEPIVNQASAESLGGLVSTLHTADVDVQTLVDAWYSPARCLDQLMLLDRVTQDKYQKYVPYINTIGKLPKGFVFDDVCTDNIYAKKGRLLGFIDPENAGYGEFIFDIAGALIMCFFSLPEKFELSRSFLKGYEKNRPLTDAEEETLVPALIFICVQLSLFFELQPEPRNTERINQRLLIADSLVEMGTAEFRKRLFKN